MKRELEGKLKEIKGLNRPEQQLDRMRQFYSKAERLENYFSKYRDKGSGRDNYLAFLSVKQGKYYTHYAPFEKEAEVIKAFEKTIGSPPRKGKGNWNRDDWAVYDAAKTWSIDYSWAGWRKERW